MNEDLFNRKLRGHKGFCVSSENFKDIKICPPNLAYTFELYEVKILANELSALYCLWQTEEQMLLEITCYNHDYIVVDDTMFDLGLHQTLYILTTRKGEVLRYVVDDYLEDLEMVSVMRDLFTKHFPDFIPELDRLVNANKDIGYEYD